MTSPPQRLRAGSEGRSLVGDEALWGPYLAQVAATHGLPKPPTATSEAGHNATYPTFVRGDLVFKFYGGHATWCESHSAELAALRVVEQDGGVAAPRVVAHGALFADAGAPWPYVVMTRMAGAPLWKADLTASQRREVAASLGRTVRRLQALPAPGVPALGALPLDHVVASAGRSSLPTRLLEQVPAFLAAYPTRDACFVHGDLVRNHVYVVDGRFEGVIDWGDALVADPHYEVGKLFFAALGRDRGLLAAFLAGAGWSPGDDFAPRVLAQALVRQAKGLLQHRGFDVFDGLADVVDVTTVATLEQLADGLFGPHTRS